MLAGTFPAATRRAMAAPHRQFHLDGGGIEVKEPSGAMHRFALSSATCSALFE